MKIIFIGGLFPKEYRESIISSSKGHIQYAADALQWSFVDGLHQRFKNKLSVINMPHVGSYPLRYKKLFIENGLFGKAENLDGFSVGFCNLTLYKKYSMYINLDSYLDKYIKELPDDELKIVIIYAMITPFIATGHNVKKRHKNVKIILIVPDLPEFMSDNDSILYKTYKMIDKRIQKNLLKSIDGYVLLTEQMYKRIPNENQPYSVIEGIFNPKDEDNIETRAHDSNLKTIFYAGTLAKRYGILTLIEAFRLLDNKDYRLVICGNGDALADVLHAVKIDNRIVYKGQIDRPQILKLQKEATVLVNPRCGNSDYTAYSFPSKTMEYLASGTPSIICKLDGIPEEYYDFCFALDMMNVELLHEKLEYVLSQSDSVLASLGAKARQFILNNKNPYNQTKKIEDLIEMIVK